MQNGSRLTPHQVGALRNQIVRLVELGLSDVCDVLDGRKVWSAQQTKLFLVLLDKVVPNDTGAFLMRPVRDDAPRIENFSLADLERMLAEALGEAPPTPAPPPAPTKAELAAERERQYQQGYERRHPELRQRRAVANARRYSSLKKVGARIQAQPVGATSWIEQRSLSSRKIHLPATRLGVIVPMRKVWPVVRFRASAPGLRQNFLRMSSSLAPRCAWMRSKSPGASGPGWR
jgi:hypothetical protein